MESYLLQSNIALVVFYLLYRLMVIGEINLQLKRFMGLSIILFCACFLLIPSLDFESTENLPVSVKQAIESTTTLQSSFEYASQENLSVWLIIYFAGVMLFSARFFGGLFSILKLYVSAEKSKKWGFKLVETHERISPFSLFNFLFIKKGESDKPGLEPIILHEQYHRDQFHSVDAMLLEVLTIFFWFNPFAWLLQREIKASHEYLADAYVISNGFDKLSYQDLLFKERTGISFKSVSYFSNQTSLKQRLIMMEKPKFNSKHSLLRIGIVLFAMALSLGINSFSANSQELLGTDENPLVKVFTGQGEVNLEEGISKSETKLYVRIVPAEGDNLKYRVSQVETTLIVDGLGRGSLRSGDVVDVEKALSSIDPGSKESTLLIEVREYQTLNEENQVNSVRPKEVIILKIPIN